jgi:hypothetical protein
MFQKLVTLAGMEGPEEDPRRGACTGSSSAKEEDIYSGGAGPGPTAQAAAASPQNKAHVNMLRS